MAQFQFNAREVEPDQGRAGAIPAGWYKTMVTKTELKPTSSGTGLLIAMTAQVVEGQFKGSNFFTNFNVQNDNEKAVEIGRKQLSALCHAVGVLDMVDTDQLKNIPFYTRLKLTPAVMDDQNPTQVKYEEKNEPNAYRHVQDQMAIAKATETAAAKPAAAPGAPAARPAAPPMQQQQQQFTPPPAAQQFQAPAAAPQQFQAPQQQFQAPQQQQQQFQPAPAPAGQPDWAAAPQQPWGAAPAQQAQQQQQAPVMSPEQQAAYAASQAAPVPWGAPQ